MTAALRVRCEQVCAFRVYSHHLDRRLPAGSLVTAAVCGLQDSPPGSAALALNARVADFSPAELSCALETEKTLVQVRSMRGAPHCVPTADLAIFTAGILPDNEQELRKFILGATAGLDQVGISALNLVDLTGRALEAALDGRSMPFRALSSDLTERVAAELPPDKLPAWRAAGGFATGQSLGEALIHFALYPLALRGLYCYTPRQGDEAAFARLDQWLGRRLPAPAAEPAQAELVRRYLHCYGPSTVLHFSEWAGVALSQAERAWALVAHEIVPVDLDGRTMWLQAAEQHQLEDAPPAEGVRLLPPHDPYLSLRDRATVISEKTLRSQIWRAVGDPGVVLAGGQLVAMWRPRLDGSRLRLTIQPFARVDQATRAQIGREAEGMAGVRGAETVEVEFTG